MKPVQQEMTVPFRLVSGTPWIMAGVNGGAEVPMMLDTGAARLMIHADTAAAHRLTVVRAEEVQVTMLGVIGSEQGRVGLLSPLRIGGWRLEGWPCFIRTHENRLGGLRFPSNILGFDLPLRTCSYLTLDYPRGQATFGFRQPYQPRKGGHRTCAPFKISEGVPFIKLRALGQSWDALVDTGSFNGIEISQTLAVRLGVQDQGEEVKGLYLMAVGGTVSSKDAGLRTLTLPEISLLGETYSQAQVDISPGPPRVGTFFLKDYRVTFDLRRRLLWLEW